MMPCNPTTRPARHMGKHSYDEAGNKLNSAKKRKQDTIRDCINKQQRLHDTVFDRKGWQTSYTTWIACSGISLRQASQPELYNLLTFHNPKIEQLVPRNDHTTPRRWIMDSYHAARSLTTMRNGILLRIPFLPITERRPWSWPPPAFRGAVRSAKLLAE